jgi:hypothetical protein
MKFLRRKETKSDSLPPPVPPPVIPDTPLQLDALPPPPPPLYARFATGSSLENLNNITVTPRQKTSTTASQSRNSVVPSVKTTSTTNSSDAHRATAPVPVRPVIRLVNKPRSDDTTTTSQPLRTDSPATPATAAYRRETSSSESTRLLKPRPPSTSSLPNPFLPPLLRQKNSAVDIASPESLPTTFNAGGTQQGLRDATQKRIGERSQSCGILGRLTLTNTCARSGHPR